MFQKQRYLASLLQSLRDTFAAAEGTDAFLELFLNSPQKLNRSGALAALLDDDNPINLNDRMKSYNRLSYFDWSYIESQVENGVSDDTTFHFRHADLRDYERYKAEFSQILSRELPNSSKDKIASITEILALNCIAGKSRERERRFIYLTNSPWAIRDFDRFVWDDSSDRPLKPASASNRSDSVSNLFVRSPLCFLHDIEMRPEDGANRSALKVFMDSMIPRKLADDRRLDTSESKTCPRQTLGTRNKWWRGQCICLGT